MQPRLQPNFQFPRLRGIEKRGSMGGTEGSCLTYSRVVEPALGEQGRRCR